MTTDAQIPLFGIQAEAKGVPLATHVNHGMLQSTMHEIPEIEGLYYYPGFVDEDAQRYLVECIDSEQWRHDLERRVQHYGWRYDYRSRGIGRDMYLGSFPGWLARVAERLFKETDLFDAVPDQAIVNEYRPRQGIALHADRQCFGSTVATLSLADAWEMKLRPVGGRAVNDKRVMLGCGSVLFLTRAARWRWMHGIEKRGTEKHALGSRDRVRRLSLTFRTVPTESVGTEATWSGEQRGG